MVARTASAKEYCAGHRLYGLVEGELLWAFDMAAVGQPLPRTCRAGSSGLGGMDRQDADRWAQLGPRLPDDASAPAGPGRGPRLGHATPERMLTEVQRIAEGVNISTVYRTLEVLEAVGLVTHAHIGHGSPAYHSVSEQAHIHLVCGRCGTVYSVEASVAEPFAQVLVERTGFVTDISHVSVHGICAECLAGSE